jgi:hypothetical protein
MWSHILNTDLVSIVLRTLGYCFIKLGTIIIDNDQRRIVQVITISGCTFVA